MLEGYLRFSGVLTASGVGLLYGYSEEHKKFLSSGYKCLKCEKTLINLLGIVNANFYSKNGAKINVGLSSYIAEIVECPSCNHRWNLKHKAIKPNKLEVVKIIETHRTEEALGSEQRLIDNSKSTSKTTRQFTVSKEWSKNYSIEYEKTLVNGTEFNVGIKLPDVELANIKVSSQETLNKKYSITEETRETYTEQVQIEVSEYKKVNIVFKWKRILEHGIIKFRDQGNTVFDIPFQVAVGVTFDQYHIDE